MQTDCPTEDARDRKMERSNNVRMRMRCTIVSKKMRLRKKSYLTQGTQNLPHLQAKKKNGQTRREKKRRDNTNRSKLNRSSALMNKRTAALETEQEKPQTLPGAITAAHHFMLLLHLRHFLGVFLVHLLQFSHHIFTALIQSLFIMDELHRQDTSLSPQTGQKRL